MGSHVEISTIARFVLKIVYPNFSFNDFLIYTVLQFYVDRDFQKKHREQYFRGYKFKVIPDELHHEIVNVSSDNTAFYDSQHQIIVPEDLFRKLYSTNIFYRDGRSLWISMRVPDVERMFSDILKRQDDLKNLKNCMVINSASFISSASKNSSAFKIANSLNMENVSRERIVQIVPHSESSSAYVYITENHLFNIKNNLGTKYLPEDDFRLKFAPIKSRNLAPTIASLIVVRMVNSSQYLGTDFIDELLSNYFKTPKFLHQYDYFGISVTEEFTGHLHMKYFSACKHLHKIYFKCVKLKPMQVGDPVKNLTSVNIGYFVIRGETELRQEQNLNSFIPQRRYLAISGEKGNSFHETRSLRQFIQSCPFGLTKYLEEILLSIEPFVLNRKVHSIHNDLKSIVQLVFLLRGELGAGTQILTSRIAEYLGIHYCVETCRRLMSTTAKQTEAKIDELFQRAKNLSPVLVHLTDFDVFGLDAEKNEDIRIVDSFVKKLKDLYENFNKFPIIFIASCDSSVELKSNLNRIFLEEFKILSPNKQERIEILSWLSLTKKLSFCSENFEQFLRRTEPMNSEHKSNLFENNIKNVSSAENKDLNKTQVEKINHLVENDKTDKISYEKRKSKNINQNMNQKNKLKGVGKKSKANKTEDKPIEENNFNLSSMNETDTKNPLKNLSTSKKTENVQMYDSLECLLHEKTLTILEKISSKTDSFVYGDLETLTNLSLINGYSAQQNLYTDEDVVTESKNTGERKIPIMGSVREKDFDDALESLRLIQSKKLGALRIPNVQWEDIGGLEDLKKEIFRTIELPLKFPHLLANSGLKRSGLLLWGPPGCGKTLVARAISSQLRAAFLSVKGPELLDMYVGQSERNMRDMFAMARASAPCVIFLDEAEAAAGARGASGDAGGAADRLVSQLLAELDGVSARQTDAQTGPVIVVAATNRPDLVEPALLRPGRLDKLLYVGPYQGRANKVRVLKASCRGFNISSCVSLEDISDRLPEQCTGADLSSVVNKARRGALARTIQSAELGERDASTLSEKDVIILNEDFQKAIVSFVPSISKRELDHYESMRSTLS